MGCQSFQCLRCPPYSSPSPLVTKAASLLERKLQVYNSKLHHNRKIHNRYGCLHDELCCHGSSPFPHSRHVLSGDERFLRTLCEAAYLSQAIDLLSQLKAPIDSSNYVSLLKACIAYKAPAYARQVYAHLVQYTSEVTPLLADYLVITFAKCGAVDEASQLFNALSHRTVLSWTALIASLTDCGCCEDALEMFQFMQEDGVDPDSYTFVSLFKACGIIKNLKAGMRLHAIAHEKEFTSNVFVGNTLVSMYIKCGDAWMAEEVFKALPRRNIVSWNGMLSVFMEVGLIENVLLSYRQLCEDLQDPDPISFMFAIQACARLVGMPFKCKEFDKFKCLEIGQALHSFARMRFYDLDLCVGTALINMYGKCGAIEDAQHIFEALFQRDVVSWNAMLSAFIEQNQEEKALQLYTCMGKESLSPGQSTFVLLFQACGSFASIEDAFSVEGPRFLDIGRALHSEVCKTGLENTVAVGNSLLMMYGKHGLVMEAEHVFSVMEERDIVSWSTMLSAYVDQGKGEKGLLLFRQMQEEGVIRDQHVLVLALQACAALSQEESALVVGRGGSNKGISYEMGQAVLVDAHRSGLSVDSYVGNVLIHMYSKCVGVVEAEDMFLSLLERDVVAWTTMLFACVEHGQARKALQLYVLMQEECLAPNQLTFVIALHACGFLVECEESLLMKETSWKVMTLEIVQALHLDARRVGLITDTSVRIAFITAYGKCGDILEAENFFSMMSHQDFAARNAMFSIYLELGLEEKALCLHKEMQKRHLCVDEVGLISLVHACRGSANLETCRKLHYYVVAGGYGKSISLATSLIHAYAGCASMEDMQTAFDEVIGPDDVCWTACIVGNAGLGNFNMSAEVFERSRLACLSEPDEAILAALLLSCTNSGFIIEGLEYASSLRGHHGVVLHVKHYGIMVGLLGCAGDLRRVENLLSRMPVEMDFAMLSSLLSACHIHCNVELAQKAFLHALLKEQMEASTYVLMSNICWSSDRQEKERAEWEHSRICLQEVPI